ncbi:MAG: hypothetical protein AB2693_33440, partial [Candidatus Thiodiazotropha sp.]
CVHKYRFAGLTVDFDTAITDRHLDICITFSCTNHAAADDTAADVGLLTPAGGKPAKSCTKGKHPFYEARRMYMYDKASW